MSQQHHTQRSESAPSPSRHTNSGAAGVNKLPEFIGDYGLDMRKVRAVLNECMTREQFSDDIVLPEASQIGSELYQNKEAAINLEILASQGLSKKQANQLHRMLLVYSLGFHQVIRDVIRLSNAPEEVVANIWKMFIFLLDECKPEGVTYEMKIAKIEKEDRIKAGKLLHERDEILARCIDQEKDLKTRVEKLESKIRQIQSSRQASEEQRMSLREQAEFHRGLMAKVENETSVLHQTKQEWQKRYTILSTRFQMLNEDYRVWEMKRAALMTEQEKLEKEVSAQLRKRNKLNDEYQLAASLLDNVQGRLGRLHLSLKEAKLDLFQTNKEIDDLTAHLSKLGSRNGVLTMWALRKIEERARYRKVVARAHKVKAKLEEKEKKTEKEVLEVTYKVKQLELDLTEIREDRQELLTQIAQSNKDADDLRQRLKQEEDRYDKLRQENLHLEQECNAVNETVKARKERLQEMTNTAKRNQIRTYQTQHKINQARKELNQLADKEKHVREQIVNKKSVLHKQKQLCKEMEVKRTMIEQRVRRKHEESQIEVQGLNMAIKTAQQLREQSEAESVTLEKNIVRLQVEDKDTQDRVAEAKTHYENLQSELVQKQTAFEKLENALSLATNKKVEFDKTIHGLRQQKKQLEKTNQEYKDTSANMKQQTQERLENFEETKRHVAEGIKKLQKETEEYHKKLQKKRAEHKAVYSESKAQLHTLAEELKKAQIDHRAWISDRAEVTEELEKKLTATKTQTQEIKARTSELEMLVNRWPEKKEELESVINKAKIRLESQQQLNDGRRAHIAELENKIVEEEQEISRQRKRKLELANEENALKEHVESLRATILKLDKKVIKRSFGVQTGPDTRGRSSQTPIYLMYDMTGIQHQVRKKDRIIIPTQKLATTISESNSRLSRQLKHRLDRYENNNNHNSTPSQQQEKNSPSSLMSSLVPVPPSHPRPPASSLISSLTQTQSSSTGTTEE